MYLVLEFYMLYGILSNKESEGLTQEEIIKLHTRNICAQVYEEFMDEPFDLKDSDELFGDINLLDDLARFEIVASAQKYFNANFSEREILDARSIDCFSNLTIKYVNTSKVEYRN